MGLLNNTQIIKRVLAKYGKTFPCVHKAKTGYNEPTGSPTNYTLFGLFHESGNTGINLIMTEGGNVNTKTNPHILTMDDEITDLLKGDEVTANGKTYKIIEVNNYMGENLVYDITLEIIL